MRDPIAPERRVQLENERARGVRLKMALESDFWKTDFLPFLKDYRAGVGPDSLWHPGCDKTLEAVALGCAFQGGKGQAISDVFDTLGRWKIAGEEAELKLKPREKP